MRLSKNHLTGDIEAVIKARIALPTEAAKSKKGCFTSFSAIVNYLVKRFPTNDNLATADTDIRNFKQSRLTKTDYSQQLWTKMLRFGFVYDEKVLKTLFVEGVHCLVCRTLCQWWSEHEHASLEDLV